ncbi:MAG: hypothetical protein MMC23_007969 [Stictis urceolatum]|nr:hypothetical protein [Stictis urceolata]
MQSRFFCTRIFARRSIISLGFRSRAIFEYMSTFSRHPKNTAPLPPLYKSIAPGSIVNYCHSCGRVIASRKNKSSNPPATSTPVKYCSERCRRHKPGALDRRIEDTFVKLLSGESSKPVSATTDTKVVNAGQGSSTGTPADSSKLKLLISCDRVEDIIFGFARIGTASSQGASTGTETNISVRDGDPPETNNHEAANRQAAGQRRAQEREMVRKAARRGCVFGFFELPLAEKIGLDNEDISTKRKCEAVQAGKVVEPSFAKGDWSVRWRE